MKKKEKKEKKKRKFKMVGDTYSDMSERNKLSVILYDNSYEDPSVHDILCYDPTFHVRIGIDARHGEAAKRVLFGDVDASLPLDVAEMISALKDFVNVLDSRTEFFVQYKEEQSKEGFCGHDTIHIYFADSEVDSVSAGCVEATQSTEHGNLIVHGKKCCPSLFCYTEITSKDQFEEGLKGLAKQSSALFWGYMFGWPFHGWSTDNLKRVSASYLRKIHEKQVK